MVTLKTAVRMTLYAEYPEDDLEADAQIDRLGNDLIAALDALPYVLEGSVTIRHMDTVPE
jgi:hypothetical protein